VKFLNKKHTQMNRIYWIPELPIGRLGMMARPRGNDWLEDEINDLKSKQVDVVVSLLESSEIHSLGLQQERNLCKKVNIEFLHFPIKDRQVPEDKSTFLEFINSVAKRINSSKTVVVHCRMGIGRTSITCACILKSQGFSVNGIFQHLSQIRTLEVPDTKEQKNWVVSLYT